MYMYICICARKSDFRSVLKRLLDQNQCIPYCQMCYQEVSSLKYKLHLSRDSSSANIQLLGIALLRHSDDLFHRIHMRHLSVWTFESKFKCHTFSRISLKALLYLCFCCRLELVTATWEYGSMSRGWEPPPSCGSPPRRWWAASRRGRAGGRRQGEAARRWRGKQGKLWMSSMTRQEMPILQVVTCG